MWLIIWTLSILSLRTQWLAQSGFYLHLEISIPNNLNDFAVTVHPEPTMSLAHPINFCIQWPGFAVTAYSKSSKSFSANTRWHAATYHTHTLLLLLVERLCLVEWWYVQAVVHCNVRYEVRVMTYNWLCTIKWGDGTHPTKIWFFF